MGVNLGFHVKHYIKNRGYGEMDPIPDAEQIERQFFDFLYERLSSDEPTFGGGWVSVRRCSVANQHGPDTIFDFYDFDVRPFARGAALREAGYDERDLYEAIAAFIIRHFGIPFDEYLEWEMYYSL